MAQYHLSWGQATYTDALGQHQDHCQQQCQYLSAGAYGAYSKQTTWTNGI